MEISQYCNIDKSLTTPFYISLLNSDNTSSMFVYKEPLKEYLDVYLNDDNLDDEFIMSLISTDTQSSINTVTMTSNKRTIKMLLTEYAEGDFTSSQIVKKILLKTELIFVLLYLQFILIIITIPYRGINTAFCRCALKI